MNYQIKNVWKIDWILIAGSILILLILAFVIAPGIMTKNDNFNHALFSFKSGSVILIDKNLNFKSPQRVEAEDNLAINLKKGIYYWKVEDAIPAEDVVQLEIKESDTILKLRKIGEGYEVVNFGNGTLNVDIYASGKFTGRVILGGSDENAASKIVYVGGEDD